MYDTNGVLYKVITRNGSTWQADTVYFDLRGQKLECAFSDDKLYVSYRRAIIKSIVLPQYLAKYTWHRGKLSIILEPGGILSNMRMTEGFEGINYNKLFIKIDLESLNAEKLNSLYNNDIPIEFIITFGKKNILMPHHKH